MRPSTFSCRVLGSFAALALGTVVLCACPSKPPPPTTPTATAKAVEPPAPPTPEPIDTGKDCAKATVECGGGVCLAKVKNDCAEPVTCELNILAGCSEAAASGDAHGKDRATIPAKAESEFSAKVDCQGGSVELTKADGMSCK
jgi:hypothetical protein